MSINEPVKVVKYSYSAVRFTDRIKSIATYVAVGIILAAIVALSYSSLVFALAFNQYVNAQ